MLSRQSQRDPRPLEARLVEERFERLCEVSVCFFSIAHILIYQVFALRFSQPCGCRLGDEVPC